MKQQVKAKLAQPLLVTRTIIGLNVAVFVLQLAKGSNVGSLFSDGGRLTHFDEVFGLSRLGIASGHWWQPLTSGFIHFGLFHIGFNMLILYRLGEQLEGGIGRLRFSALYFTSLFAGSFGVILLDPKNAVGGGASGAIFGVGAAATVALRQRGVNFWQTGWGPMLGINMLFTVMSSNISLGAHLGGLIAGAIVGLVMLNPRVSPSRRPFAYLLAAVISITSISGIFIQVHRDLGTCTEIVSGRFNCQK